MGRSRSFFFVILPIAAATTLGIFFFILPSDTRPLPPPPNVTDPGTCIYGDFVSDPSETVVEIDMPAYQWRFAYCSITVYEGQRIVINMRSLDVPHGFAIDGYDRVRAFIPPDVDTRVDFIASLVGEYVYFCTVFCGEGHALHQGTLIVI